MKNDWMLPRITDYWDSRSEALEAHLQAVAGADPDARVVMLESIRAAVTEHVRVLPDRTLLTALATVADDLLKVGNRLQAVDGTFGDYLDASAGVLFSLAQSRYCCVHYLVDNIFKHNSVGMHRPTEFYPHWFRAAGLVYICPQAVAIVLMKEDKCDPNDFYDLLPNYITEALTIAWQVVDRCDADGQHYVFLNADNRDAPFSFAHCLKAAETPGIITVVRNDAPVAGSVIRLIYPPPGQTGLT